MTKNKTVPNDQDVMGFLEAIANDHQRSDAIELLKLIKNVVNLEPKMWGDSIVGFGTYHYRYESGREGDMFLTGFSPRKNDLTIYVMTGFENCKDLLQKLGKHKIGKSCLYIKKLQNIDQEILKEIISDSVQRMVSKYH
ncbi:MAG: DUF1801 domain-containing protein [Flavobacteriaceae bacterium]|nr:DUF1801 domain-containing protein [Flavobacteriaceae bacterium]